jgi:hypothetical protein
MGKNLIAAAAVIFVLSACSRTSTVTTQDAAATVSVDKGNDPDAATRLPGKDAALLDLNPGNTIADYPGDVPLYAGKSAMDMKSNEKHGRVVMIQTPDSVDTIAAFYKSQFADNGWKFDTAINTEKMVIFKASKDNRDLVVQIGSDGNLQSINQTLEDR